MSRRTGLLSAGCICLFLIIATSVSAPARTAIKIKIDWQPSPEYYGFFYAVDAGFYREAGYDVQILYGSGAPAVAAEVATGAVILGTTTSDNILRWAGRGGEFSRVVPIFRFNPSVIVSLAPSTIRHIADLRGRRLGTNPQASYYSQLQYLLKGQTIAEAGIIEDASIGFGGIVQLKERRIDAMLAYTTNAVVDLEIDNLRVEEVFLGDEGAESYGLVLAVAAEKFLRDARLSANDIDKLTTATLRGYRAGAEDVHRSVAALAKVDVSMKPTKADFAIRKIARLNGRVAYPANRVDRWVDGPGITQDVRDRVLRLYR